MADTETPNFEFILPELKASKDTWGAKTNDNWLTLDALLLSFRNYIQNSEPIGTIKAWGGTLITVPTGYAICDGGTYEGILTPDLRERFIIGAKSGGNFEPGDFGGALTHNHGGFDGNTTLTAEQIPLHSHIINVIGSQTVPWVSAGGGGRIGVITGGSFNDNYPMPFVSVTGDTGTTIKDVSLDPVTAGQPHNHSITAADHVPPYFALAYIMRVKYPWT